MPAGQEGLVSFNFNVAANAAPGLVPNTATLNYGGTTDQSNTVDFRITRNTSVAFTGQA